MVRRTLRQMNAQFDVRPEEGRVYYGSVAIELNGKTAQLFHDKDTILDWAHRLEGHSMGASPGVSTIRALIRTLGGLCHNMTAAEAQEKAAAAVPQLPSPLSSPVSAAGFPEHNPPPAVTAAAEEPLWALALKPHGQPQTAAVGSTAFPLDAAARAWRVEVPAHALAGGASTVRPREKGARVL